MERKPSRAPVSDRAELPDEDPPLTIKPTNVVYLIARAKELAVKDPETEPEPGSNPSDDRMVEILENHPEDDVLLDEETRGFIESLSQDEQIDLVALAWLGRDDYTAEDWPEVRQQAVEGYDRKTARYLLGMPLLANYLEAGLATLGYSVEELESDLLS